MANLTMAQIKENAKVQVLAEIQEKFNELNAIQFGDFKFAVPVVIEGKEIFVKIDMVTAQFNDTKVAPAFDPQVAREEWIEDKDFKAKERAEKELAKAKKVNAKKKIDEVTEKARAKAKEDVEKLGIVAEKAFQ